MTHSYIKQHDQMLIIEDVLIKFALAFPGLTFFQESYVLYLNAFSPASLYC